LPAIAAALALASLATPLAAQAQVAAGAVPNTFDGPPRPPVAAAAPAAAQPGVPPTPANAGSEDALRDMIATAQAGRLDFARFSERQATELRPDEAEIVEVIRGFGALQAVDFVGAQDGADLFVVTFSNAAAQWIIGFDDAGKIDAFLFRPAP
jgi:hypothetical protein